MSSIELYVGIPNQNARSLQGQLADLVGDLMRIPRASYLDQNGDIEKYQPIIPGASTYLSIFGFWHDESGSHSRIDDRSELFEFLAHQRDHAPSAILILAGFAFPAIFATGETAVLAKITCIERLPTTENGQDWQDPSVKHREFMVQLMGADPVDTFSHPNHGDEGDAANPAAGAEDLAIPECEILSSLEFLQLLVAVQADLKHKDKSPSGSDALGSYGNFLQNRFDQWMDERSLSKRRQQDRNRHWKHYVIPSVVPKDILEDVATAAVSGKRKVSLPTTSIWTFVHSISWWVMWSDSAHVRTGSKQRGYELFSSEIGAELGKEAGRLLETLEHCWMLSECGYIDQFNVTLESEDPMLNGAFWLAFSNDFLDYFNNVAPVESNPPADEDSAADHDNPDESRDNSRFFEEFVRKLRYPKFTEATKDTPPWWKAALAFLRRINDARFPDRHLLDAWQFFLSIREFRRKKPWEKTVELVTNEEGHPITFKQRSTINWFVEAHREWSRMGAIAKMWNGPALLELLKTLTPTSLQYSWARFARHGFSKLQVGEELNESRHLAKNIPALPRLWADAKRYLPIDPNQEIFSVQPHQE